MMSYGARLSLLAAILFPAVTFSGCTASPRQRPILMGPVDTGPGTLAEARKYLEGRWTLQSFTVTPTGQPPIKLTGSGTLIYDQFGNLEMEIRADESSAKLLAGSGIETAKGVLSTRGRTAVDLQARTLTYILEGQPPLGAPSGPLALNRPRHWQVEENVLTLTINGDDGRPAAVGQWLKVP
jgi:hypothetical protein